MISQLDQARVTRIIAKIAEDNKMPPSEVRAEMTAAMMMAMNSPNPMVRERWKSFCFDGSTPSLEEFIIWLANLAVKEKNNNKMGKQGAQFH